MILIFLGFFGIFESRSRSRDFEIFRILNQGVFRGFHILFPIPGISGFRDFRDFSLGIFSEFSNPDPDSRDYGIFESFGSTPKLKTGIPKKSHPEANSTLYNKNVRNKKQLTWYVTITAFSGEYFALVWTKKFDPGGNWTDLVELYLWLSENGPLIFIFRMKLFTAWIACWSRMFPATRAMTLHPSKLSRI